MNRNCDLTDKRDFCATRIPKRIKLTRLPWHNPYPDIMKIPWLVSLDSCERCGANNYTMPWDNNLSMLCKRCSGLLTEKEPIWQNYPLKDKYDKVFLSEFMDERRRSL